jgi:hypothetical protein
VTLDAAHAILECNVGVKCATVRAAGEREREKVDLVGSLTRGGSALALKQPTLPNDIESGPGGLTREVETPSPSNSPHDHIILRVDLVGSHGRWKRPCLQTAHMTV